MSNLVRNPKDRFSRDEAHILLASSDTVAVPSINQTLLLNFIKLLLITNYFICI